VQSGVSVSLKYTNKHQSFSALLLEACLIFIDKNTGGGEALGVTPNPNPGFAPVIVVIVVVVVVVGWWLVVVVALALVLLLTWPCFSLTQRRERKVTTAD